MPDLLRLLDGPLKTNAVEYPLTVWPPPERLLLLHFGDGSTIVGVGDAENSEQVASLAVLQRVMECERAVYLRGAYSELPDDHPAFLGRGAEYNLSGWCNYCSGDCRGTDDCSFPDACQAL